MTFRTLTDFISVHIFSMDIATFRLGKGVIILTNKIFYMSYCFIYKEKWFVLLK